MKNKSRETRIQGIWLSISRNRCSITRWSLVLLKNEKKKRRQRFVAFFKSVGKVLKEAIKVIVALSSFVKLALIIMEWLGW